MVKYCIYLLSEVERQAVGLLHCHATTVTKTNQVTLTPEREQIPQGPSLGSLAVKKM